ncbi:hypothetical protein OJ997_15050 [Solirubrobacter phytolaccae]|uniref:CARDB domain-containing protein n=1 Tax=Solirubrobacter phytolaccae TaxID=1404360 RepID=A0A9X3N8X6_9ACTN|nr:hypothetical protein [Solirubrobacter phytolaccae]MDA0181621.1 hypothetical protein [Solirubrobacter phytolaccae]
MKRRSLAVAVAALSAGVFAAPAAAQVLPPSLTTDTRFAFAGVSEFDFQVGVVDDTAVRAAVDPARERAYAVGSTGNAIAVVARRADGALDPSFAGDGSLELALGRDAEGVDIGVRADGRLLVLARTDVASSGPADYDTALIGLLPDGSTDPSFGTRTFAAGPGDDVPAALDVNPRGWAYVGATGDQTYIGWAFDDMVFDQVVDVFPAVPDGPVDIAWQDGAPVVLASTGTSTAVRRNGVNTEVAVPLATSVTGGGLLVHDGSVYVTGAATVAGDSDAYLARLGATLETRRFDFRGSVFSGDQPVTGVGQDITLVPGDPDTVVVSGSSETDRGREWGFAAFNGLEGALSALQATDLVIPVAGQGGASGVAGAAGYVVAAGTQRDFSLETQSGTNDLSIGMGRVLIDNEKRCDLALAVVSPVELVLRGRAPGEVTLRVTNNGKRPCAGTIGVPAPWVAAGSVDAGRLLPGQTVTRTLSLGYDAPFPNDATLELSLSAAGDSALGDNAVRLRAIFSFCDLALTVLEAPPVIGTEGSRRFAFTVRNVGTAPCRAAQVITRAPGLRSGAVKPYSVAPGKSVEDEISVGVLRGLKTGTKAPLSFRVVDADDVAAANDLASSEPVVVKPGDTNARTPVRGISFSGRATKGTARFVSARTLRVARVQIAVRRLGGECRWLSSARGDLRTVDESDAGKCDEPVWITVKGTERWSLRLAKRLPKGLYELRTRAVLRNGLAEGRFTRTDKNLIRFRVR